MSANLLENCPPRGGDFRTSTNRLTSFSTQRTTRHCCDPWSGPPRALELVNAAIELQTSVMTQEFAKLHARIDGLEDKYREHEADLKKIQDELNQATNTEAMMDQSLIAIAGRCRDPGNVGESETCH